MLLCTFAGLASCGDSAETLAASGPVCRPAERRACFCPNGETSEQFCRADGAGWTNCRACGIQEPGIGDAGVPGGTVALDGLCFDLELTLCAWLRECTDDLSDCNLWEGWPDFRRRCTSSVGAAAEGWVAYDAERAEACLDRLEQGQSCTEARLPFEAPGDLCATMFRPVRLAGQGCLPDAAFGTDGCLSGYCRRDLGACPGVCTQYAAPGEACSLEADLRCTSGSRCNDRGLCEPVRGLGEVCVSEMDCEAGLACVALEGHEPVCQRLLAESETCLEDVECEPGALCSDAACTRSVSLGDRCLRDQHCPPDIRCAEDPAEPSQSMLCLSPVGVRDPCVPESPACSGGLFCDAEPDTGDDSGAGVCRSYAFEGQACAAVPCDPELSFCYLDREEPTFCVTYRTEGQLCRIPGGDELPCADALFCMGDGQCHPIGEAVGGRCSAAVPETCGPGLYCRRGDETCQRPQPLGGFCNPWVPDASCEADGFCQCATDLGCPVEAIRDAPNENETCVLRLEAGGTCRDGFECQSERCNLRADGSGRCGVTFAVCASEDDFQAGALVEP